MRPAERHPGRWRLGLAIAIALFAFARLRGELSGYVAIHRWLAARGVPPELRQLDHSLWIVGGALLAARLAWGRGRTVHGLGLGGRFVPALRFALLAAAPMLLQGALASPGLPTDLGLVRGVLLAPLVEELFFRGALVAIPVRCGRLPFWPVAVLAGLLFGAMHVPWGAQFDPGHLGVLAATTAGGIWYAWLLRAFDWNLWTTILLHAAMNAAWMVFAVADDAAGGLWPNVGRGLTIAAGTALAVRHRRLEAEVAREEAAG
ncbi:MAG: CPBP family intramembrane metalloprotease [Planctomycetes bacterium]|nr:CPBP family intramembrane metalloprotease [Planctomycetota bacterium]